MTSWRTGWQRRGNISTLPKNVDPDWYKKSFSADYELIYRRTDSVASSEVQCVLNYLRLADINKRYRVENTTFLDLGCGWGRHDVELATLGFSVCGVDLSENMIGEAVANAERRNLTVDAVEDAYARPPRRPVLLRFVKSDLRDFDVEPESFDVALSLFTSFGYFADDEDNLMVLQQALKALKPGGRILIDIDNPEQYVRSRLGRRAVPVTDTNAEGIEVTKTSDVDIERERRVVRYMFEDDSRPSIYLECKLYGEAELREALEWSGFTVQSKVYGSFDGQIYKSKVSPRLIMIGQKPPDNQLCAWGDEQLGCRTGTNKLYLLLRSG